VNALESGAEPAKFAPSIWLSVGGGVGGASTKRSSTERFEGCGDDLCELGGVVDEWFEAGTATVGSGLESPMSFSSAAICLPQLNLFKLATKGLTRSTSWSRSSPSK
jgi:hypothetical protein